MTKFKLALFVMVTFGSFILFLNGCGKPEVVRKESLGIILDMDVIPTSFNKPLMCRIKTEKAVVVIWTIVSVPLGKEAWIIELSDGTRRLKWEGSQWSYFCY